MYQSNALKAQPKIVNTYENITISIENSSFSLYSCLLVSKGAPELVLKSLYLLFGRIVRDEFVAPENALFFMEGLPLLPFLSYF